MGMSNLLKKFTDQLSGPNNQQNSSSSGGILHKVTDAVTGQKHPQDYQNRPNPQTSGFGYGAGPGSGGYQNSGYPGEQGGYPGQYSNHGGQQDYLGQQRYPEGRAIMEHNKRTEAMGLIQVMEAMV